MGAGDPLSGKWEPVTQTSYHTQVHKRDLTLYVLHIRLCSWSQTFKCYWWEGSYRVDHSGPHIWVAPKFHHPPFPERVLCWGRSPLLLPKKAASENQAGLCGWIQHSRTKSQMTGRGGTPAPQDTEAHSCWKLAISPGSWEQYSLLPPFLSPTSAFNCKFMGIK